ncbi:hypothetical protein KR059_007754, partial [Drosophila kikkawai]
MEERRQRQQAYRRARRKFACLSYMLTVLWMVLALIQWLVISLIEVVRDVFIDWYWISIIFFVLAMILVTLFIFIEKIRYIIVLNWVITILIVSVIVAYNLYIIYCFGCLIQVEFVIVGLFALAAKTLWPDLILWFFVCVLLLFVFILLGSILPHDLTLDVVTLFVVAFIFLVSTVFFIMVYVILAMPYSFLVFQIFISIVVLLFVMYHAQTINGGRFAEMRLSDYLLASLILFLDFIILFLLTFYSQIVYKLASSHSSTT